MFEIEYFSLISLLLPLLAGWVLDFLVGDPEWLPHPIVLFGKTIACGEKRLNKNRHRKLKGACFALFLILFCFFANLFIIRLLNAIDPLLMLAFNTTMVFFCLASTTLIKEVKQVFNAVDSSIEAGRKQVGRIVGRDTSQLTTQQIKEAALETLSENLSDGVIAPLFWYVLLGIPGMLSYKMINTLDSMIGYKNERYKDFGCFAAHIDDIANWVPARLTAFLMIATTGKWSVLSFVKKYAKQHTSPNAGYPEAALAGILGCRFGGPNIYFGKLVEKPYIGENERELTNKDVAIAVKVNRKAEIAMVILVAFVLSLSWYLLNVR